MYLKVAEVDKGCSKQLLLLFFFTVLAILSSFALSAQPFLQFITQEAVEEFWAQDLAHSDEDDAGFQASCGSAKKFALPHCFHKNYLETTSQNAHTQGGARAHASLKGNFSSFKKHHLLIRKYIT